MPQLRSALTQARAVFAKHRGAIRTAEALRLGIHPRTLYQLRDSAEIEQIGRGLYRLASDQALGNPDWIVIASKATRAVFCLISALSYHRLTTQIPHTIDIAIPSHAQLPRIDGLPIRAFWYSDLSLAAGVEVVKMDGVAVRVFSAEKTIADCFKYRNKIGLDVAVEALRMYRERNGRKGMKSILHYAEVCRVKKIMLPYIEAML
jgi:predicted transcriptional regulator of viral defense system